MCFRRPFTSFAWGRLKEGRLQNHNISSIYMENPAVFQTGGWRAALPFGGREKVGMIFIVRWVVYSGLTLNQYGVASP